ncbi:MAG TPA: hypothetical protein EYO01_00910 [Phycisphaerales bacterium]|nr:hypothetical protein [Phycisphaerales bacterium]HIB50751.1 hypothetical protein [Phycisphaerales bacterium]HIN83332.1 hypothetical protein [Phycisphaerales bacterium]
MQVGKPCHLILAVPDETTSSNATSYATKVFQRLLANWAQDLLLLRKKQELRSVTSGASIREPGTLDKAA